MVNVEFLLTVLLLKIIMMTSILKSSIFSSRKFQTTRTLISHSSKIQLLNLGKVASRLTLPLVCASAYYFYNRSNKIFCNQTKDEVDKFQKRRDQMKLETMVETNKSILSTFWSIICHTFRFFQLLIIFTPVILTFPLRNFQWMKQFSLDCFVKAVERAGVVWIKAFQYMSHRRDIIGQDMAHKFQHLRQDAPQHSFKDTQKMFFKKYGKKISEVFQNFEQKPIASGSVSQVYKAMYKGQKVAIKVRHPDVEKHIQRDVNLLFFFSRLLSCFSRSFALPVSEVSMKKTLMDQIDFNNEKDNLVIFNKMFQKNKQIRFPKPIPQVSNDTFLVESFVEGVPITYYERHPHKQNRAIARCGANTLFQMLMQNNFIHADCHGGNIMVEILEKVEENRGFFQRIKQSLKQYLADNIQWIEDNLAVSYLQNPTFKKLYNQAKKQILDVKRSIAGFKGKVNITLIDVGMVIRLQESDRLNFITFLKSVIQGDGQKCAQMIYNLSIFDGQKINMRRNMEKQFESYMVQLRKLFSAIDGQPLDKLQGVQLLVGMLDIIRQNNMKLEGEFATLLTNMLVLEAMAKSLDPKINILKLAIPYFKHTEDIMEKVSNSPIISDFEK